MKKVLFTSALMLLILQIQGKTLYVKKNGNGNGKSWSSAFGNFNEALQAADVGDQIWVAKGVYYPTTDSDRSATFRIPSGVEVYGGFNGTEKSLDARNWNRNVTILSGEIGDADAKEDNSYTVVYISNADQNTLIDGFTITGGYAFGTTSKTGDLKRSGGGLFNDGYNGASLPTIQNCVFKSNYARDGAAIYNYGVKGDASATIINCTFAFNKADLDGGAINNNGTNGICNARIQYCSFLNNEASYGAGILNRGENGEASPLIAECDFTGNTSYFEGSSVYNFHGKTGLTKAILKDCQFKDNKASVGSEIGGAPGSYTVEKSEKAKASLKFTSGG